MTKNQIWVVIIVLVVGLFALLSDVEVKIQVGSNEAHEYLNQSECRLREMQKCPNGSKSCNISATQYCARLEYPNPFGDTPIKDDK